MCVLGVLSRDELSKGFVVVVAKGFCEGRRREVGEGSVIVAVVVSAWGIEHRGSNSVFLQKETKKTHLTLWCTELSE